MQLMGWDSHSNNQREKEMIATIVCLDLRRDVVAKKTRSSRKRTLQSQIYIPNSLGDEETKKCGQSQTKSAKTSGLASHILCWCPRSPSREGTADSQTCKNPLPRSILPPETE